MIKVLLVDNNDKRRATIRRKLDSITGLDILDYSNIERDEFSRSSFDLIFIHMSNPEFNHLIKSWISENSSTKFIVFSGNIQSENVIVNEGVYIVSPTYLMTVSNIEKLVSKLIC